MHGSELANDQNDLLQLISLNDSDTEHRDEQLPDLNVERSGKFNLTVDGIHINFLDILHQTYLDLNDLRDKNS